MRISADIQEWEDQETNERALEYSISKDKVSWEMFPTLGVELFRLDNDRKDKSKILWLSLLSL